MHAIPHVYWQVDRVSILTKLFFLSSLGHFWILNRLNGINVTRLRSPMHWHHLVFIIRAVIVNIVSHSWLQCASSASNRLILHIAAGKLEIMQLVLIEGTHYSRSFKAWFNRLFMAKNAWGQRSTGLGGAQIVALVSSTTFKFGVIKIVTCTPHSVDIAFICVDAR